MENLRTWLFIINDGPYGNERPYNALRTALSLAKRENIRARVFLIGDGVQCGVSGQETPKGYYNVERMLKFIVKKGQVAT